MEMAITERFTTEKAKCVLTWFTAPLRLYRDIQQDCKFSVAWLSFPQGHPSENNYLVVPFLTQEEIMHCPELLRNIHQSCKYNHLCTCMPPNSTFLSCFEIWIFWIKFLRDLWKVLHISYSCAFIITLDYVIELIPIG